MSYLYTPSIWSKLLTPVSWLLGLLIALRRALYRLGLFKTYRSSLPVIIVGNITVGGNGKTPLVIWLCEYLRKKGYKPGIISRGYGGKHKGEAVSVYCGQHHSWRHRQVATSGVSGQRTAEPWI